MGEVIVRAAVPADYNAIHGLNKTSLGYDYDIIKTKQRMEGLLGNPAHRIFVAELDGKVYGYIHGTGYESTYADPMVNVLALAVDGSAQGKGIGKALLLKIEEWSREKGFFGVRLNSGMERKGAHQFYFACGYTNKKDHKYFVKLFSAP